MISSSFIIDRNSNDRNSKSENVELRELNSSNGELIQSSSQASKIELNSPPLNFDICTIESVNVTSMQIEEAIRHGPKIVRKNLPDDHSQRAFPTTIFTYNLPNGEIVERD